jgi:MFS family permease
MVSDGVPSLLLPHRLLGDDGGSAASLGSITFVAILLAAAVQPVAGTWSDRVGSAPVIASGVLITSAGLGVLALSSPAPGGVLALLGVSVAQAGYQRFLPDRIVAGQRGRGAGLKGFFDLAGAFAAFSLLGGLLTAGAGPFAAAVLALCLAGSLALGLLLLGHQGPRRAASVPQDSRPRRGDNRKLAWMIAGRFLFLLGVYVVGRFLTFYVAQRLQLNADAAASQAATLLAVLALVTALTTIPAGWLVDRFGRAPLTLAGGIVAGAGIATLPLARTEEVMLLCGVLMALGTAAFGAGSWAAVADLATVGGTGKRMGVANIGTAGAAAAAGLFGLVIDYGSRASPTDGYALAFSIAAATAVAGGLVAWKATAGDARRSFEEVAI